MLPVLTYGTIITNFINNTKIINISHVATIDLHHHHYYNIKFLMSPQSTYSTIIPSLPTIPKLSTFLMLPVSTYSTINTNFTNNTKIINISHVCATISTYTTIIANFTNNTKNGDTPRRLYFLILPQCTM